MNRSLSVLALLVSSALGACRGETGEAGAGGGGAAPIPVRVSPVTSEAVRRPATGTGVLEARREVDLAFKVDGVLARVSVAPGARVQRGQVLATLDPREIEAAVRRAEGAAAKAERDLNRARELYADSVVTLEQLQDATTASDVATAEAQAAHFIQQHASIVAPSSGTVLRRIGEPGELIAGGTPVVVFADAEQGLIFRVALADRDVVRVHPGDSALVRFTSVSHDAHPGVVHEVGAAPDPGTGTYDVKIALASGTSGLPMGLIGQAEIIPREAESLNLVPVEAIAEAEGPRGVLYALSDDGKVARRIEVDIAFITDAHVAIRKGLEGVGRVITGGVAYLRDGTSVSVVP